ncbi:hypothetical protein PGTUg99_023419 [Puccinia graminis f. sp. tritici]|uniref:Uncharacterized protein n=1 Tax=Puccinia graminis f. sp. tritici TaxID=56615 RepID=A0A5B0P172_PUCGR|nr:hypothetical protein PGTUg99_023419 [Puccinia graminis f. sp. tritici]
MQIHPWNEKYAPIPPDTLSNIKLYTKGTSNDIAFFVSIEVTPRSFGCRPECNRHLDESACVTAAVGAVTAHETPNETPRCRSARERHAIVRGGVYALDAQECWESVFQSIFTG